MRHATKDVSAARRRTDNVMGRTDLIGKVGSARSPPPSNAVTGKRGSRGAQGHGEDDRRLAASGCCRRSPASASRRGSRSARGSASSTRQAQRGACSRRASSSTRTPAIGHDLVQVYERNGIECRRRRRRGCCGAPFLHSGDVDAVRRKAAAKNVQGAGRRRSRQGNDIVVPQPTCGYVLKKDYVDYVGGPDAELVAEHTYDAAEYLMKRPQGRGHQPRHRLPRRRPRDDHVPRALPPAGPEHRAEEPRPDEADRRPRSRSSSSARASTACGACGPRTPSCRCRSAQKLGDEIDAGRRRGRGRRLPPRQHRHHRADRARAAAPDPGRRPRLRHPRGDRAGR